MEIKILNCEIRKKIIFLCASILFSIILSAQIKIAEDKTEPEKPDWWDWKDSIFAPYDSSYVYIKNSYPTLDAYRKYIGQQLFLPYTEKNKHYSNNFTVFSNKSVIVKGYSGYTKESYLYKLEDLMQSDGYVLKPICNKYYDIIDVLDIKSEIYNKHYRSENRPIYNSGYSGWERNKDNHYVRAFANAPYFVLRETG